MFIFILQNYLQLLTNNGNSNKLIRGTRFILWLLAASFLFLIIIAVKHSDAKPLVGNSFYNFAEQSLGKLILNLKKIKIFFTKFFVCICCLLFPFLTKTK